MDDLVQWLGKQLDEDAALAEAASPGPWHANAESDEVLAVDGITVADGFALSGRQLRATTEHIARHDPARVLRETDAKRQIIAEHDVCSRKLGESMDCQSLEFPCTTLRLLAVPYADRPGYRDDWRP
ncbi:DUF6221 family protein [Streptomyces sp. NPDC004532]